MRAFLSSIDDNVWDTVEIGWTRLEATKSESSNSIKYTMNVWNPKSKITNSSFMTNTKCAKNEHKL